jgi:hypothetical protein
MKANHVPCLLPAAKSQVHSQINKNLENLITILMVEKVYLLNIA